MRVYPTDTAENPGVVVVCSCISLDPSNVIDKNLANKKLLFNLILTRSCLCGLGVGRRRVKG